MFSGFPWTLYRNTGQKASLSGHIPSFFQGFVGGQDLVSARPVGAVEAVIYYSVGPGDFLINSRVRVYAYQDGVGCGIHGLGVTFLSVQPGEVPRLGSGTGQIAFSVQGEAHIYNRQPYTLSVTALP